MKPSDAHVLIVGAGGIGCPALWGLVAAGVGRVRIVDPDVVELSNLPRQVLYTKTDVGAPKAPVAARAFPDQATQIEGVHARLDHTNADELLREIDVVIDATDGATTKDWINQLCVRVGVPLVHAAGLRSEARMLVVPVGGKPCLACLFGRLVEETGSCADLGVWNGVVGTIGFMAAEAALALLVEHDGPTPGYVVLDFEARRSLVLGAEPDPDCPVCARPAGIEPYPEAVACAPLEGVAAAAARSLDLRAERCPMNLLRARRALADMETGGILEIELGAEGAETVPDGVRALGHTVLAAEARGEGVWLQVRAGADGEETRLTDEQLRQYARQIVLPEVGEEGQRRLFEATVEHTSSAVAECYLRAAGVGKLEDVSKNLPPELQRELSLLGGVLFAEHAQRALVLEREDLPLMQMPRLRDHIPGKLP